MEEGMKKTMIEFFCNNYDVIAHSPTDMKGVSKEVIEHKLNVKKKKAKAVKQKKRNFIPDWQEVIKEKVNKLLNAISDAISEVMYPKWLANIMLIRRWTKNEEYI